MLLISLTSGIAYSANCRNANTSLRCMICNCYHESRGEIMNGTPGVANRNAGVAVSRAVMSRVKSDSFPNSVCGVVKQRAQFSWWPGSAGVEIDNPTHRGRPSPIDRQGREVCESIAREALEFTGFYALYFHTRQVSPRWSRGCRRLETIGNHIFYRDCSYGRRASQNMPASEALQ